jgi:vitamin B12/bleomycin/antimicrobial peptide transport system ATP-binding/permease protein
MEGRPGPWTDTREPAAYYNTNGSNGMSMVRSGFWRDFWALFKPYWFSEEKVIARLLLFSIIALTLASVYMDVQFNAWYNLFYNTLQDKNKPEFYHQIGRFCILAAIYIVIYVYSTYLNQMLQIRWRRWLTRKYQTEWMSDRTYYHMQLTGNQTDNPDQRISEDLKLFVDSTLSLSLGLLNAVVSLVAFVGILWTLSGALEFPVGGDTYVVHGYMVWVALGYAVVGTWLAHKIGKSLIALNFNQQRYEADFRFNLVRLRENMEGVALYRGEEDEMRGFRNRFAPVYTNWWSIMRKQKNLNFFAIGYNQAAVVFPFLVAAPRYFSGAIPMGGLIQISHAFGKVQDALSWLINVYSSVAAWRATVDRLTGFHNAIAASQEQMRTNPGIAVVSDGAATLALDHVELDLPNGQPLLSNGNLTIAQGSRVLIQGPSGSGKSTLFRAIAGIWPFGRGRIYKPHDFNALFLPQRPYFPLGTLREVVVYPKSSRSCSEEEVLDALSAVGLAHLIPRLDESANWAMQLSWGEQQRVAFARALLQKPAWLFLDEASSNLDDASQARLYDLLTHRLKDCTIVSIAHREELARYHQHRVTMQPGPGATHRLSALQAQPA